MRADDRRGFGLLSALFLLLVAAAAAVGAYFYVAGRGPEIAVRFDKAHPIAAGDPVRLDGHQVGTITAITADGDGTVVRARIAPDAAARLTSATTFTVDTGGSRALDVHVLDGDARAIADGATFEGADSGFELALRKGKQVADDLLGRAGARVDDLQSEFEAIDWDEVGERTKSRATDLGAQLEKLTRAGKDEVEEGLAELRPELETLIRELEEAGRSEEAERLREELRRLWQRGVDAYRDATGN